MICEWALLVMHWSCTISIHKKVKRCITSTYFDWHRIFKKIKRWNRPQTPTFRSQKTSPPIQLGVAGYRGCIEAAGGASSIATCGHVASMASRKSGLKMGFFGVEKWLVMVRDWRFKHTRRVTKSWFGAVWLPGVFKIAHHMGEWFGASISSWEIMMTWDWPKGDELKLANGLEKSLWPKKPWKCPTYVGWLLK